MQIEVIQSQITEARLNLQKQVNVAQGALIQAKTSSLNPEINTARITGLNKQLAQAQAQLKTAIAELANTKAAQAEIKAKLDDFKILSPIDGVVLTLMVLLNQECPPTGRFLEKKQQVLSNKLYPIQIRLLAELCTFLNSQKYQDHQYRRSQHRKLFQGEASSLKHYPVD